MDVEYNRAARIVRCRNSVSAADTAGEGAQWLFELLRGSTKTWNASGNISYNGGVPSAAPISMTVDGRKPSLATWCKCAAMSDRIVSLGYGGPRCPQRLENS